MNNIAKKLSYRGNIYEYSHSKNNIMVYISQPTYHYDDWIDNGGIIVVEYRPNVNNHRYIVLHELSVNCDGGHITHNNISNYSKIAEPYGKDDCETTEW